jgi:hypothetical protein
MAANKEQCQEIIEAAKSMCFEHGDVSFMVVIKDEDGLMRYSMNISAMDAMTMIATISSECVSASENE